MTFCQIITDIDEIPEEIEQIATLPFFKLHPFFLILFGAILIYSVCVFIIPLTSLLINNIRHRNQEKNDRYRTRYKQLLFDYMISEQIDPALLTHLRRDSHKRILINLIYDLAIYVKGREAESLKELFVRLELHKYIIRRISSPICYKRAYYLRRMAINYHNRAAVKVARDYIYDKDDEVRLAAIQAILRMRPDMTEQLFIGYPYQLSAWEQMCYYNFFAYSGLPVPDFHPLTYSRNDSVVLFALRMIRMFKQKRGSVEGFEFLLNHPNLEVQGEMFRGLAEFGYDNVGELVTNYLPRMPLLVQMHIITFLSKRTELSSSALMRFYYESDSPDFRLHVLYCIYNFIQNGKEEIEQYARQTDDKLLQSLSSHLITNVI